MIRRGRSAVVARCEGDHTEGYQVRQCRASQRQGPTHRTWMSWCLWESEVRGLGGRERFYGFVWCDGRGRGGVGSGRFYARWALQTTKD